MAANAAADAATTPVVPVGAAPVRVAERRRVGEAEVLDAVLACVARWGPAKTTVDDIAREAGCSRATLYRLVPGGKPALLAATARREVARLLAGIEGRLAAAPSLESALVAGISGAARWLLDHEALGAVVTHEPESLLPHLAFDRLDPLLDGAAELARPHLVHFVAPATADHLSEWAVRLVLSYCSHPSPAVDLRDEASVAHLVRTYVLPGVGVLPTTDPATTT